MGAYILRRLLLVIPTLFGIMVINFALTQFVPGGPIEQIIAQLEGEGDVFEGIAGGGGDAGIENEAGGDDFAGRRGLPKEFIEELEREFGFDKPAIERFFLMMWNYVRFDFGESYFRSISVVDLVIEKLPVSISLGLWSTLIAYLVSIPLGVRKAVRDGSAFDTWTSGAIIVGYAIPGFLFAILLLVLFAGGSYIKVFPLRGLTSDDWDQMSFLGRYTIYGPWLLAVLGAALVAGAAMFRRMAGRERRAKNQGFLMAAGVGLVLMGLVAMVAAGNALGSGREHLWLVIFPALLGMLSAWWFVRRMDEPRHPPGFGVFLFQLVMTSLPGVFTALLIISILSISGSIQALPPGVTGPEGEEVTLFGQAGDYFWHIALPVVASTISAFATLTLLTKNSFLDEIKKQYVMTAKAKGLTERRVLYGHVFRNGMLIVIAGFPAVFIGIFFSGSLIIETIFSLDGLGRLGFEAAVARDYPVVFGTLFVFGIVGLVIGILSDLMYVFIDPRIDFERRG